MLTKNETTRPSRASSRPPHLVLDQMPPQVLEQLVATGVEDAENLVLIAVVSELRNNFRSHAVSGTCRNV